ncbi:MAG: hypothetical protein H0W07_01445 [Chloroflexi bacterium]|nr:hypothetical protein [Chloroflexota bacterium]
MDHAEALERLDEAFLGPGKIWSVETDRTPDGVALREHLAGCPDCRGAYGSLTLTGDALAMAAPDTLVPSSGARDRVLSRVRAVGVARAHGRPRLVPHMAQGAPLGRPRRAVSIWTGLAVAASIVLLVLGGVLGRALFPVADPAVQESRRLTSLASAMSDLLADPAHRAVRLRDATSMDAGLLLVSGDGRRLAVTSNAIDDPGTRLYDCYVERGGERILIGPMHLGDGLAYWAGPVQAPAELGRPGDRFIVLERGPDATPELSATF